MQELVADIRNELATAGIEFTYQDLEDILNAAAELAAMLGGKIWFDCGEFWGIHLEIDPEDPQQQSCYVAVIFYEIDPNEEMN